MTHETGRNHCIRLIRDAQTATELWLAWDSIGQDYKSDPKVREAKQQREKEIGS